jgi:hypothetical protein
MVLQLALANIDSAQVTGTYLSCASRAETTRQRLV